MVGPTAQLNECGAASCQPLCARTYAVEAELYVRVRVRVYIGHHFDEYGTSVLDVMCVRADAEG